MQPIVPEGKVSSEYRSMLSASEMSVDSCLLFAQK